MKPIQIELPEKLAEELTAMVNAGWFSNESEVVHFALLEFVQRKRLKLLERFQQEDIAWALQQHDHKE
jgi:Arc/MetJ-type ribon-helix-helix transcriptional regulator